MKKLLVMTLLTFAFVVICVNKIANEKREKRYKYLRESFSPMSDDKEIQNAYDEVRSDPYIIGTDASTTNRCVFSGNFVKTKKVI